VIALIELIKNAYDADADSVTVRFVDPLRPSEGEIVISDDGVGMSAEVLQAAWMEPASPWKKERPRSSKGRRVTGEKGPDVLPPLVSPITCILTRSRATLRVA
jgi:hypothetical protein